MIYGCFLWVATYYRLLLDFSCAVEVSKILVFVKSVGGNYLKFFEKVKYI